MSQVYPGPGCSTERGRCSQRLLWDLGAGGRETASTRAPINQVLYSWPVTNGIQNAVIHENIESLPLGSFCLDPEQEEIARGDPPLLIESRSGTGKTNVLFQHAVSFARARSDENDASSKPILFVTVSPRLRKELAHRFEEVKAVEEVELPQVEFLSLKELLNGLLRMTTQNHLSLPDTCTFFNYLHSRKSHAGLSVEASLVENEIGGVILGSLRAARAGRPLTRDEYNDDKRSNIENKTERGRQLRQAVYDEFECYMRWKKEQGGLLDINDVVLRLLGTDLGHLFQSVYLDEVQDFSYAAIYLICLIGGRESLSWTFAGDTAQMISPGCSFKFAGLKQTLLEVHAGIEKRLSSVSHLLVNYRTTRDVLNLGNAILHLAKKYFPGAIEYSSPEVAMKDTGQKVRLVDWDEAFSTKVAFGPSQALVFSSYEKPVDLEDALKDWLGDHPFILTSLESKGLEFDDVVVAFDLDRKVWNINPESAASLRMLRELYVAVTRAKRRVVVLMKRNLPAMAEFFESLDCDFERVEASTAFLEFDAHTAPETWLQKGHEFFDDEKFDLAAGCFHQAGSEGWSYWAQGLHAMRLGSKDDALVSFRNAARFFLDEEEYHLTLDILKLIKEIPPWLPQDTLIYDEARSHCPGHYTRAEVVHFALVQDRWGIITTDDMKEPATATLLAAYRNHSELQEIVQKSSEEDHKEIAVLLPNVIGDYYASTRRYSDAVRLHLKGHDQSSAARTTEEQVRSMKTDDIDESLLLETVIHWEGIDKPKRMLQSNRITFLLLRLFESPESAASTCGSQCLRELGAYVIKSAVRRRGLDETLLHDFHPTVFQSEVLASLKAKHGESSIEVARWYVDHDDETNAISFAAKNIRRWTDEELIAVVSELNLRPNGLNREFDRRGKLLVAVELFLKQDINHVADAVEASDMLLSTPDKARRNGDELLALWRNASAFRARKALKADSILSKLLFLFENPIQASRTRAKECFCLFGRTVVQKAVFRSENYGMGDVKSALVRFHKSFKSLSVLDMIRGYQDFGGGEESVHRFLYANSHDWTDAELCQVTDTVVELCPPEIVDMLEVRNLFLARMKIALERRDLPKVIECVDHELTAKPASDTPISILTLWRSYVKPHDPDDTIVLHEWRSSNLAKLLLVREDALLVLKCKEAYHVLSLLGPGFVRYSLHYYAKPDNFEAYAGIKLFHDTLRENVLVKATSRAKKARSKKKLPEQRPAQIPPLFTLEQIQASIASTNAGEMWRNAQKRSMVERQARTGTISLSPSDRAESNQESTANRNEATSNVAAKNSKKKSRKKSRKKKGGRR